MLGAGGVAKKVFSDDVFSTYLYKGNGGTQSINNGIDLAGEGGMTWLKNRGQSYGNVLYDTVRGAGTTKSLVSNDNNAEGNSSAYANLSSFNSNGFTIGTTSNTNVLNQSNHQIASWTFRKAKGFFDVVTWTGNGTSGRTISHSLGCVPGLIMVKCTSDTEGWEVYHRSIGPTKALRLNGTDAAYTTSSRWNDTQPTSSVITLGNDGAINSNGRTYVAYVFAGGESTAATARSVDFNGVNDNLQVASHSDFTIGTGDFTAECWVKSDSNSGSQYIINRGSDEFSIGIQQTKYFYYNGTTGQKWAGNVILNQWVHIAVARSSGTTKIFINGIQKDSFSDSHNYSSQQAISIANSVTGSNYFNGKISNVRLVNGTAVYTSSFRPPTEPLTNITNTKLLCCNNSSTTGSTVTPSTITDPTGSGASTDSPFDDPAGFKFGNEGDQNVIKCGSFVGNGSTDGPEVFLGWEPQWILYKNVDDTESWRIVDSTRGIPNGSNTNDQVLYPNNDDQEEASGAQIDVTPTGFKITTSDTGVNGSGETSIWMALRRPDGYVGKPVEDATKVFAMDTGNSSSTIPAFDSGFTVDMRIGRKYASSEDWYLGARNFGKRYLMPNQTNGDNAAGWARWDSNIGEGISWTSDYIGYMWKRHAGFDVVTWKNDTTNTFKSVRHTLGKKPEMIWLKSRNGGNTAQNKWYVWHSGLTANGSLHSQYIVLNTDANQTNSGNLWGDSGSYLTNASFGYWTGAVGSTSDVIAMLFASVDGISKVGSYTGSSSDVTITTGFQPRFVIIKRTDAGSYPWMVLDTLRGWGSSNDGGDDPYLRLNQTDAQVNFDNGYRTSTGFVVDAGSAFVNTTGSPSNYIYYAHA